jgi:hypothetical protein
MPLLCLAAEYSVTITKDGSMYRVSGTSYYLKITGCYEYGFKAAILNTLTRTINVEKSYSYGSNDKYNSYYYTVYEKIDLPAGTIDQNGLLVWTVYVPTTIN